MQYINKTAQQQIDWIRKECKGIQPLVAIRSLTYNHEHFIRDTLEGFINQKTSFPFVAIVHDDASTDGTADIIREYADKYPHIILPIFENENQNSKPEDLLDRIMKTAIESTGAEFIAICEGDDYWTDPLKLQKQVDFMEANPDYGMCYTNFDIYNQSKKTFSKSVFDSMPELYPCIFKSIEDFITRTPYVCPPSWLIRKGMYPLDLLGCYDGTFVQFTHYLATTKVAYLNFTSCTYRVLLESAAHTSDFTKKIGRERNLLDTQKKLVEKYSLNNDIISNCIFSFYQRNIVDLISFNQKEDIAEARKVLKGRCPVYDCLFLINDLGLNKILLLIVKLKRKLLK